MFHDESAGVKKLTVVVVKLVIKKDGVSMSSTVGNSLFDGWTRTRAGQRWAGRLTDSLGNFRSDYEYDYEYEFSVLSTRTLKNVDLET